MSNVQSISKESFIKRLLNICLKSGLTEFPSDHTNQHIMFKSVILNIDKNTIFSEKEINQKLDYWAGSIGDLTTIKIDHVTLRRLLVDAGYLIRNRDGSCYQVSLSGDEKPVFDDAIEQIDVMEVIKSGRDEIARRKREYMERSALQGKER